MTRRILILVELKGGNDGLNTVIPYADPLYRQLRGGIALSRERTLQLDEKVGLHDKLEPLMEAWKAGDLAVVQGVGYPYPNRSHFRSIEIWDTASASNQTLSEGWIAQVFKGKALPKGAGVDGIVADTNSLPLTGPGLRTIVMPDAENFLRAAEGMKAMASVRDGGNPALRHLLTVRQEINGAAAGLRESLRNAPQPTVAFNQQYPNPAREFELATRLVLARVPVVAIKVALGGFDTHANQTPVHENLIGFLASSLATLRKNLVASGQWNDVLVMTYSEFGRRVRPNASAGTDHGSAAPHFIMGGKVKGGLHGVYPPLADLLDGDLRPTVDFRTMFASVARDWWGITTDFGVRQAQRLELIAG